MEVRQEILVLNKDKGSTIALRAENGPGAQRLPALYCSHKHCVCVCVCFGVCLCSGYATEKDGTCSSSVGEGEALDEEDEEDEDERGAETEEQSGNESEMNEPEEEVSAEHHDTPCHQRKKVREIEYGCSKNVTSRTHMIQWHSV